MPLPPGYEDWDWPPKTLEIAKRWAREKRCMERGLALDDPTSERVAQAALVKRNDANFGTWYTPEGVPARLQAAVDEYLRGSPGDRRGRPAPVL